MSKRLPVLLPDQELSEIQRLAKREHLTVGEWVRRALREARASRPVVNPERASIGPAFEVTLGIVDEVIAIEKADVLRAAELTQDRVRLSARDAVHIAVMERHGIRSILSFDGDFDGWPGLQRIHRI